MLYSSIILTKFPKYWSTGFATTMSRVSLLEIEKILHQLLWIVHTYIFFCKEYYMRNMRDMNCIEKLHVSKYILLLYFSLKSLKRIKKECDIFQHLLCLSTAIFEPYEQLQSMPQVSMERKRLWVETCCLPPITVNEFTTRCLIFTMVDGRKLWEKSSEQFQWLSATLFKHKMKAYSNSKEWLSGKYLLHMKSYL